MREAIHQIIHKYRLVSPGSMVVVGVSGGADSLALLHVLSSLRSGMDFSLHAATLDHSLRGQESASDVRHVQTLCDEWDVPVTTGKIDVGALAQRQHLSIESAARLARYDFLAQVARQAGATRIAVAHHVNDQAETVLLRLLRGTGLHGLRGMAWTAAVPGHADLQLIRPFLQVTRAEIEQYCAENAIAIRQDSSNQDTTILRNHLRLEVLPLLEKINPQIQRVLARLADSAAVDDDYMEAQLAALIGSPAVNRYDGRITVRRDAFAALHPALQRRMVLWAAGVLGGAAYIDHDHVLEAIQIGLTRHQGALALLGGGLQLRVDYETLVFERKDTPTLHGDDPLMQPETTQTVLIPGTVILEGWVLQAALTPFAGGEPQARLAIPPGAVVTVRTRREGEHFAPLGMGGHRQKLNRWMINHKIPRAVRQHIPIICINDEAAALFVAGAWTVAEPFAVRGGTPRVVYLTYVRKS